MAKDDRLRVSIDQPYLVALGQAFYCFNMLEWNAVYVREKIAANGHNPRATTGFVGTLGRKTAGKIADRLVSAAKGITNATLRAQVLTPSEHFKDLVVRRNDLIHANPGTAPNLDQRLFRYGGEWTISKVEDLADAFTACSIELNNLYHKVL